jgi:phosphohistidine phosphatase
MKRLLLMRHAHADPADAGTEDIDRHLSTRGRGEALDAADRIAGAGLRLDALLVSPALRTRETATIVAAELDLPLRLTIEPELYPGDPAALLRPLSRCPAGFATVMIVGHNPGISELAQRFKAQRFKQTPPPVELHTAGLCLITFPADTHWAALKPKLAMDFALLR